MAKRKKGIAKIAVTCAVEAQAQGEKAALAEEHSDIRRPTKESREEIQLYGTNQAGSDKKKLPKTKVNIQKTITAEALKRRFDADDELLLHKQKDSNPCCKKLKVNYSSLYYLCQS